MTRRENELTKPGDKKTARDRYGQHRESARIRDIPFLLTFEEWWDVWTSSGCWDRRGTGPDRYCMARFLDKGAYEIGNVKICTNKENWDEQGPRQTLFTEGHYARLSVEEQVSRSAAISRAKKGKSYPKSDRWYDAVKGRKMVRRNGKRAWARPGDFDYPKQESDSC